MKRQNIIIVLEEDREPIAFGNFKKTCVALGLPYHSLKMLHFPIRYAEFEIHKVKFN